MHAYKSEWHKYHQINLGHLDEDVPCFVLFTTHWRQIDKNFHTPPPPPPPPPQKKKKRCLTFHSNCLYWNESVSGQWRPGSNYVVMQADIGFCRVCNQCLFSARNDPCTLTLKTQSKIFSSQHIEIFFLFFLENKIWHLNKKLYQFVVCWTSPKSGKG